MRAFTLMQTFTFRELDAIRGALLDDITRRYQPIDTGSMEETLLKIDDVMDAYCRPLRYDTFVLLPLRAKNDEE